MKLTLESGMQYGVDKDGKRICTGAQMGRRDVLPASTHPKLRLERLRFVDECYDAGGAYWGCPANVWCAWDGDGTRIYRRGDSRQYVKETIQPKYPQATFYR